MSGHITGSRAQWLSARLDLLAAEKALTRQGDAVAELRRGLPWVRVEAGYAFDTEDGRRSLAELFQGRSQLLVYHFMFGPEFTGGCPSCSMIADGYDHVAAHLAEHDVMLWTVSRAPLAKLLAYRRRMGWSFPWASSVDGAFNRDFGVWFTPEQAQAGAVEYNYRREPASQPAPEAAPSQAGACAAACGVDRFTFVLDRPGVSAFALRDGEVFHTYSSYGRGVDAIWASYAWLDRAPLGRNETGEVWWRRRDEYGAA